MPIHEYSCKQCGRDFEHLVRAAEGRPGECPSCGSNRLLRKLSVFAAGRRGPGDLSGPACSGEPSSCRRCGPAG